MLTKGFIEFNTDNERVLWENLQVANKKAKELLKENSLLKENINRIMQRLKQLEKDNKTKTVEQREKEYYIDEEELERETDWIIKSNRKNKKRKANSSPEVFPEQETTSPRHSNTNTNPILDQKRHKKEKKNLPLSAINIIGVKQYQDQHALIQEITTNFKVITLNNNVIKINVSLDE